MHLWRWRRFGVICLLLQEGDEGLGGSLWFRPEIGGAERHIRLPARRNCAMPEAP
jgi:hypothetical protein